MEDNEDVSRNVNWKLIDFQFDNLFNYGDGNSVNFEELSGIVGILVKTFVKAALMAFCGPYSTLHPKRTQKLKCY